jgi:putative DNA primase/helicase
MFKQADPQDEDHADGAKPNGSRPPNGKADTADTADGSKAKLTGAQRKRVLDKIRKLLALGFGPGASDAEGEGAYKKARKLMEESGIRIEEVYGVTPTDGEAGSEPEPRPEHWPDPVEGGELVSEITKLLKRHVIAQREHYLACALWVIHAHCHDAAMHSPILMITAPTMGCGKSTLLECLEYLVPRPLRTSHVTSAAIFHRIERYKPTVLMDEADTFAPDNKDLLCLFNDGYRRGGKFHRKDGDYSIWAPKAVALNEHNKLAATLQSRSIIIKLQRKAPDEVIHRVKPPQDKHDDKDPFNAIRMKCVRWAKDNAERLVGAEPDLPSDNDRTNDNWRPLIAIADLCKRPQRAREAAVALTGKKLQEPPIHEQLLRGMQRLFERDGGRLPSTHIVQELLAIEDGPWNRVNGAPLNVTLLSHLLKPFDIKPKAARIKGKQAQCYRVEQFVDAFRRYCPPPNSQHRQHPQQKPKPKSTALKRLQKS